MMLPGFRLIDLSVPLEHLAASEPVPAQIRYDRHNSAGLRQMRDLLSVEPADLVYSNGLGWFLGGLNFQIEHHLFPRICHVNYSAIAHVVEQTCRQYGVRYAEHETLGSGLRSHVR